MCVEYFPPACEFNALTYSGVTKVSNSVLPLIHFNQFYVYSHDRYRNTHVSKYSARSLASPRVIFLFDTLHQLANHKAELRYSSSLRPPHPTCHYLSNVFCRLAWHSIYSCSVCINLQHYLCRNNYSLPHKRYRLA